MFQYNLVPFMKYKEKHHRMMTEMSFNKANFHIKESLHVRIRTRNMSVTTEFNRLRYNITYEGN